MRSLAPDKTAVAIPSERPKGPGQPCLIVIAGPQIGRQIMLDAQTVEIGRSEDCSLYVDSPQVSRRHACVQKVLGHYIVADLHSTNGTFVNNRRIDHQPLQDGDQIRAGPLVVKYVKSHVELQYHQQLVTLATLDPLTGAQNKRVFDEHFEDALKGATSVPVSLILFDIDHFKQVNDTFGHPAGDAVLKHIAGLTTQQLSPGSGLYRVGGEEFAILCPKQRLPQALELAERCRQVISNTPLSTSDQRILATVSLGVAERQGPEEAPASLYARADEKLYLAKSSGRNRTCS